MKVKFNTRPEKTNQNPCAQVGIGLLRVWGQPLGYHKGLVNESSNEKPDSDAVDKVLIEMGIPLNNVKWTYDNPENYNYAPVDDHTRITLQDMEKIRDKAHASEDYEALKQITKDLRLVFDLGNEILNLKRELEVVLA